MRLANASSKGKFIFFLVRTEPRRNDDPEHTRLLRCAELSNPQVGSRLAGKDPAQG